MSSFSPVAPQPSNTLTGNRLTFFIEGTVVGFANQLSYQNSYTYAPMNVLGSIEVVSHIPTGYSCSITFNAFRVLNRNLRTLNLWPKIGKNPQDHLIALSQIPELTAMCTDPITNQVVLIAEGVRMESESVNAAANSILMADMTTVCRRILLEGDI